MMAKHLLGEGMIVLVAHVHGSLLADGRGSVVEGIEGGEVVEVLCKSVLDHVIVKSLHLC